MYSVYHQRVGSLNLQSGNITSDLASSRTLYYLLVLLIITLYLASKVMHIILGYNNLPFFQIISTREIYSGAQTNLDVETNCWLNGSKNKDVYVESRLWRVECEVSQWILKQIEFIYRNLK